jgi:hypothetical protein
VGQADLALRHFVSIPIADFKVNRRPTLVIPSAAEGSVVLPQPHEPPTKSIVHKLNLVPGGRIGLYQIAHVRKSKLCHSQPPKPSQHIDLIPDLLKETQSCVPLRTTFGCRVVHIVVMTKRKQCRKELAREIISSVKRERQKPRLTESVRRGQEDHVAPVVEAPPAHSKGNVT